MLPDSFYFLDLILLPGLRPREQKSERILENRIAVGTRGPMRKNLAPLFPAQRPGQRMKNISHLGENGKSPSCFVFPRSECLCVRARVCVCVCVSYTGQCSFLGRKVGRLETEACPKRIMLQILITRNCSGSVNINWNYGFSSFHMT